MTKSNTPGSDIVEMARQAGIAGQGGAGFPLHAKLATRADTVIANGCECEPMLATDTRIMEAHGEDVVAGLRAAMLATGASNGVIALKAKHTALVRRFRDLLAGDDIRLHLLENFYPAGDEQILVHETTGRSMRPLSLPGEVGCVVSNVGSLAALARAARGEPVTDKYVTVSGEVRTPSVFAVPLGTPVRDCINHCGGSTLEDYVVVLGGPMMGAVLDTDKAVADAVVTKTVGGILLFPRNHHVHQTALRPLEVIRRRAATSCIQCRFCTDLCPRHLIGQPFDTHRVMRAFGKSAELDGAAAREALLCCGCGVCEHIACPMGLSPCAVNAFLKQELGRKGVRYEGDREIDPENRAWREARRIPVPRLASRIGISRYMGIVPAACEGPAPEYVDLPLKQHIGVPAEPVCKPGDSVRRGQVVAEVPEGSLGARLHAGIDGIVVHVDASICIRRA